MKADERARSLIEFRQLGQALLRFWVVVVLSGLAVGAAALAVSYVVATYEVRSRVLLRPVTPDPSLATVPQVGVVRPTTLTVLELRGDTYASLVSSRQVAETILERLGTAADARTGAARVGLLDTLANTAIQVLGWVLNLGRQFAVLSPRERDIHDIQEAISGRLLPKSTVFEITVKHRDPVLVARLATLAADAFTQFSRELSATESVVTRKFLEEQVRQARGDLEAAQARLEQFRRGRGVFISLDSEAQLRVTDLLGLESTARTLQSELRQSERRVQELRQALQDQPKAIQSSVTTDANPIIRDLRIQLLSLESRLPPLLVDLTPNHPQVAALQKQIAEFRTRLQNEVERVLTQEVTSLNPLHQTLFTNLAVEEVNLEGLTARKAAVDALLAQLRGRLSSLPTDKNAWDLLSADVKFYTSRLEKVMSDLDGAQLTEAKKLAEVQVLEIGPPPSYRTWKSLPLLVLGMMGLAIGVVGGSGVAIALHALDRSVKDPEIVSARVDLPLYGVVPERVEPGAGDLRPQADAAWNAYRYVRLRLLEVGGGPRARRCAVLTGLGPDRDLSAITARLSAVFAEAGARTLLVDCRSNGQGARLDAGPFPVTTVDVLTDGDGRLPAAGDPHRLEKLADLVKARQSEYDVVLLLTSSLDVSVDAVQLALTPEVDILLLTVWHLRTSLAACEEAKARLDALGVRQAGFIYVTGS